MAMVFCRGCGKEIHESAPTCPTCGALQNLPSAPNSGYNTVTRILAGIGWTLVFWLGSLFALGLVVGIFHPDNAQQTGAEIGKSMSGILLLISIALSVWLTIKGLLPGTKSNKLKDQA